MTVIDQIEKLRQKFISFHIAKGGCIEDAKLIWWERMEEMQEWSSIEQGFVFMSNTKTLKVMKIWVSSLKL